MSIATDFTSIWKEYQDNLSYHNTMEFSKKWPEFIRFIEGDQWPKPTEKTKFMPRPVINQCDFIIENKQSNILSQSVKMVYSPEELPEDSNAEDLTQAAQNMSDAAESTWYDLDQDALNEDAVNDVLSLGTAIYHYYFDNAIKGGMYTKFQGKLQGQIIDPKSVFFGNPQLKAKDVQKQPYIIIESYEDTDLVQERAKANGQNALIISPDEKPGNKQYDSEKKQLEGLMQTTVLTKYYREKGEVFWTQVTESGTVVPPKSLTPVTSEYKMTLYPIEVLVFKKKRKCTYGRSIIEDIIPNQKALNWGIGMMLLSVQQTAWPKIITKVNALMQSITNEPGEIITDHNPMQGVDGIKYMQPPNFSNMPIILSEKLLEFTRQVTGTTEVTSGEMLGANMAASAIIALQNQAKKPNEAYQNKLFRSAKNIGRIWEEFYKAYYNMERPISSKDTNGKEITKKFKGSDYAQIPFGLKIDVGPASVFSESLQMTSLDKMYTKGDIDKYQYAKYAPSNVLPHELKHDFEQEQAKIQQAQETQNHASNIMNGLTPEEIQHLKENPDLIAKAMASVRGGGA